MRKLLFICGFAAIALGISSCDCNCYGPNDGNPNNKVCKEEYEAVYGTGSWAQGAASYRNAGYICK